MRKVLHADLDAYYAQIEQRDDASEKNAGSTSEDQPGAYRRLHIAEQHGLDVVEDVHAARAQSFLKSLALEVEGKLRRDGRRREDTEQQNTRTATAEVEVAIP